MSQDTKNKIADLQTAAATASNRARYQEDAAQKATEMKEAERLEAEAKALEAPAAEEAAPDAQ